VAQDVIVTQDDCGTVNGIYVEPIVESGEIIEALRDRIVGRVALEDQRDYEDNLIVAVNTRSRGSGGGHSSGGHRAREDPLRADLRSKRGVCQLCYGRNLAPAGSSSGARRWASSRPNPSESRARSSPCARFHIGGAATRVSEQSTQDTKSDGFAKFLNIATVRNKVGDLVAMNRIGILAVVDEKGREKERYQVVYGAKLRVETARECEPTASCSSGTPTPSRSSPKSAAWSISGPDRRHHLPGADGRDSGMSHWVSPTRPTRSACRPLW